MSQTDAAILLGAFTTFLLPFAHSWMKSQIIPDWIRFLIALAISALGGFLTAYVSGRLVTTASVIELGAIISTAGAGIYITAFGNLGLERWLYPRASVIADAQKSVAGQIGTMSTETIKDAVDPNSSTVVSVRAQSFDTTEPSKKSVTPQG